VDSFKTRSVYTKFASGPKIELSAPGICLTGLAVGGGEITCIWGTSFATPHVSGAIAAIRAKYPTWSASYVRERLKATATKVPGQTLPSDVNYGYGIINPYAILSSASPLSVTLSGPTTVRPGVQCLWTANPVGGGGTPYTYAWLPGGGSTQSITMSFSSSGTLTVYVGDGSGTQVYAQRAITVSPTAPPCMY